MISSDSTQVKQRFRSRPKYTPTFHSGVIILPGERGRSGNKIKIFELPANKIQILEKSKPASDLNIKQSRLILFDIKIPQLTDHIQISWPGGTEPLRIFLYTEGCRDTSRNSRGHSLNLSPHKQKHLDTLEIKAPFSQNGLGRDLKDQQVLSSVHSQGTFN